MNITLEFELFDLTAEPTPPEPTAAGFGGPYAANTWVTNVYAERKELGVENKNLVKFGCNQWSQPNLQQTKLSKMVCLISILLLYSVYKKILYTLPEIPGALIPSVIISTSTHSWWLVSLCVL